MPWKEVIFGRRCMGPTRSWKVVARFDFHALERFDFFIKAHTHMGADYQASDRGAAKILQEQLGVDAALSHPTKPDQATVGVICDRACGSPQFFRDPEGAIKAIRAHVEKVLKGESQPCALEIKPEAGSAELGQLVTTRWSLVWYAVGSVRARYSHRRTARLADRGRAPLAASSRDRDGPAGHRRGRSISSPPQPREDAEPTAAGCAPAWTTFRRSPALSAPSSRPSGVTAFGTSDARLSAAIAETGGFWISGSFGMRPPQIGGDAVGDRLDVVSHGLGKFAEEYVNSVEIEVDGLSLRVLKLERIIASKRAAGRPKDLAAIPALEEVLAVLRSDPSSG